MSAPATPTPIPCPPDSRLKIRRRGRFLLQCGHNVSVGALEVSTTPPPPTITPTQSQLPRKDWQEQRPQLQAQAEAQAESEDVARDLAKPSPVVKELGPSPPLPSLLPRTLTAPATRTSRGFSSTFSSQVPRQAGKPAGSRLTALPSLPTLKPAFTSQAQLNASSSAPKSSPGQGQSATRLPSSDPLLERYEARSSLSKCTVRTLLAMPANPSHAVILRAAASAFEFRRFPVISTQRAFFSTVAHQTPLRYPMIPSKNGGEGTANSDNSDRAPTTGEDKVWLLTQLDLSGLPWPNRLSGTARKELVAERASMRNVLQRVLRCAVDVLCDRGDGQAVRIALELLRAVIAGTWEGKPAELRQVKGIGDVKVRRLSEAGITSVKQLAGLEFYHIERLISRNPPFGQRLLLQLASFPDLVLRAAALGRSHDDSNGPVVVRATLGFANRVDRREGDDPKAAGVPRWLDKIPWVTLLALSSADGRLVWMWRESLRKLAGGKGKVVDFPWEAKTGDRLDLDFSCEGVVGTLVQMTLTAP